MTKLEGWKASEIWKETSELGSWGGTEWVKFREEVLGIPEGVGGFNYNVTYLLTSRLAAHAMCYHTHWVGFHSDSL